MKDKLISASIQVYPGGLARLQPDLPAGIAGMLGLSPGAVRVKTRSLRYRSCTLTECTVLLALPAGSLTGKPLEKAVKDALYGLWLEQVAPAAWSSISPGQVVYVDNYQGGAFPQASPLVSGPSRVVDPAERSLGWETPLCGRPWKRVFRNWPEGLLATGEHRPAALPN